MTGEWESEVYFNQRQAAEKITDKGIKIALNQRNAMKPEAVEAYEDVLRERQFIRDINAATRRITKCH
jgi:hypothetical protein